MCEYCGCQQIAVIDELTREHEAVVSTIGEVRRALDAGSVGAAAEACRRMSALLGPHTVVEEDGLFPYMAPDFPEHVDVLREEHRSIDAVLREAADGTPEDPTWPDRLQRTLHDLREHILKEQDGVFPAALGVLDGEEWERIEDLRAHVGSGVTAHPEQHDHHHEHGSGRAAAAPSGRTPR
jgi:hemerythrin-like domain-containing protein